jgi:hypothetical protein
MSAMHYQPVTHDIGMRISWNNRPAVSVRPEVSDAKMGLPDKDVPWQMRRANMQNVCINPDVALDLPEAAHHKPSGSRRAASGRSNATSGYTHWHGTYEVARTFDTHFVPELEELIEQGHGSGDPVKVAAAEALQAKLDEVLASKNHRWYIGEMDPEEAADRAKAAEEFKKRYAK